MNEKKEKLSSKLKNNLVFEYSFTILLFVILALIVTLAGFFILDRPAINTVHKVESVYQMQIKDVTLGDKMLEPSDSGFRYGSLMGVLECEKRGISANIYVGENRISARKGVGIYHSNIDFSADGSKVLGGYDSTYLASLKSVKNGDVFTVTTVSKQFTYEVTDVFRDKLSSEKVKDIDGNNLVVVAVCSSLSDDKDYAYYAVARFTGEEVVANGK